ncbi:MAG TPA: class I SAM-dependent methyltransferase [Kribbellaceae bacterium]|nr:class I SAM-dependent methyltransferase [Kribbellaceae bacterium]
MTGPLSESTDVGAHRRRFEAMYDGDTALPWDRGGPNPVLADWARGHRLDGTGRTALVIGCGLGGDSEFVASLGFDTTAFDFVPAAIEETRRRYPDSRVDYSVANLLDPPADWTGAFDFVLESLTVQSLSRGLRGEAIDRVRSFIAPGGTLLVIAGMSDEAEPDDPNGPWPLTRTDIESFATADLALLRLETPPGIDNRPRWRVEFRCR